MSFDPHAFKASFPLFSQPENQQLVYLDNAATSQRPQCVVDAINHFYTHSNANTHRSSHRLARAATAMLEKTRQKTADFFGAEQAENIVFTSGATASLNLLAHSLCRHLQPGDEIVLSRAEHHANLVPWQMQAQQKGLVLRFLADNNGVFSIQDAAAVLTDKTRIVSLTAASNVLGFINPVEKLAGLLNREQTRLIIDGSQIVAHQPVNLRQLDCDFFVCSAHKFYGPTGIGILYGKTGLLNTLPPWQGGGEMIRHVGLHRSSYADAPQRFEAGTASLAAIAGLSACIDFLQQQDRAAMHAYEQQLLHYLHQRLQKLPFIQVISSTRHNVGIAAISPAKQWPLSCADIAHYLDEADIAVRSGHLCAEPLLEALQQTAVLRISLAAYNTEADINLLINTLQQLHDGSHKAEALENDKLSGLDINRLLQQKTYPQRYKMLMQWADHISEKPAIRTDKNRVSGCESNVWLTAQQQDGRYSFFIDSDSRFIKGLAALLLLHTNGTTAQAIQAFDAEALFSSLGLDKHLSPSRQNGFYALLKQMRELSAIKENSE